MGFTRQELLAAAGRSVPDLVGPGCRLLFVGINPGLWTAAAQAHFAKRGNRFYQALHRGGLTRYQIDASAGMDPEDALHLIEQRIGISNLVNRATARADELKPDELAAGSRQLAAKVATIAPQVVVILGVTAYRVGFSEPRAQLGWQPHRLAGAELMVAGNPSGLNAHQTVEGLAAQFAEAGRRAGIELYPAP
ncbi:MAG TPA: mismatch-specific DNA-glycosylase [Acidimicrobiia bacterium]|nr:mismatch-specific DNA-glycosylase [Acidimicrobiia bacterium]